MYTSKKWNDFILLVSVNLIFLMETQFFHLNAFLVLAQGSSDSQKMSIVIVIFLTVLLIFPTLLRNKFLFNKFVFFIIGYLIFQLLISIVRYNLNVFTLIKISTSYFVIVAYYIFTVYISENGRDKLVKLFLIYTIISVIFIIVQYLGLSRVGVFLNAPTDQYHYRFNSLRMSLSEGMINVAIIISFGLIIRSAAIRSKIFPFFVFLLCLYDLIFIQKTRVALICTVVSCIFMIFIKFRKHAIKLFIVLLMLLGGYYFVSNTEIYQQYLGSYTNVDQSASTTIRAEEQSYYLNQFYEHPFIGMGFVSGYPNDSTYNILRGGGGYFYREDVGVIGLINMLGLIGLMWFFLMFIKICVLLYSSRKHIDNHYELVGVLVFFILTSSTLIVTDPQRIIALPIFLSVLDSFINTNNQYLRNVINDENETDR